MNTYSHSAPSNSVQKSRLKGSEYSSVHSGSIYILSDPSSAVLSSVSAWRLQAAASCSLHCGGETSNCNEPTRFQLIKCFGRTSPSMNFSSRDVGNGCSNTDLSEEDIDNLQFELTKVEDEIQTLRQVLLAKEHYAADIRAQLGLSPMSNIKQNLSKGWHEVQTSSPYLTASATLEDISNSNVCMRTRESLSYAGQVTTSALSSVGVVITRKLTEMRALPLPVPPRTLTHTMSVPSMRHSSTFKSFEEMVGNVKEKVTSGLSNSRDTSGFDRGSSRHTT
ncbi:tumor protein D54-like [Scomber scombrus]|uniref:tumor protein D54-like n=1 Tax=Scomber scombrus TaxID=13677 RepID=UPI002DD84E34|nr:tumor protein D54-like [Scomber scombrus]